MDKVTINLKNQQVVVEELVPRYSIWIEQRGKWAGWMKLHEDDADPRLVRLTEVAVDLLKRGPCE